MASTCSIILWLVGVGCFIASVVFDWGNVFELLENYQKINSTWNSTTGNSTTRNSTGIESCDFALDKYHWIFMSFVILKMISGIYEYVFGGLSLWGPHEHSNDFDTASLIFNLATIIFQVLDLLLLVLFSYHCLGDDEIHHVRALISDEADNVAAGFSGTVGLVLDLVIKKNTVTIFKASIDIIRDFCGKEGLCRDTDDLQDPEKYHKILTWISVFFIFVCIGLVLALSAKL